MVVKKDGRREPFDRQKIRLGLVRACEKRPISVETIDQIIDTLERKLHELCEPEIVSQRIGDLVMEELKKLDKIAYVRFASVYREFSDVNQFVDTLKSLDEKDVGRDSAANRRGLKLANAGNKG
jgi:transcriptional repressor NrdR